MLPCFLARSLFAFAIPLCWPSACLLAAEESTAAEAPAQIDFARDVAPIFEEHCLRCHNPENLKGDVSLATPKDLLEQDYLKPAKPAESYLVELIAGKGGTPPRCRKKESLFRQSKWQSLRSGLQPEPSGRTNSS